MRRHLYSLCLLFLAAIIMASCLNSDNDDVTFYDDAAITAFSLTSAEMTRHTTASTGEDSTYVEMGTDVSSYNFVIDQQQGQIYNTDSLPLGTNPAKILCTYSTKNNSLATIQSMTSDTLSYLNTTDTLDFTTPRTVKVYSTSGQNEKTYTITVNVHKETADSMKWTQYPDSKALAPLTDMKAYCVNGDILVMAPVGGQTKTFRMNTATGRTFSEDGATLGPDAYNNAVVKGNTLYVLDGQTIKKTTDGHKYDTVLDNAPISKLVAASTVSIHGLTADNKFMKSTDDCATWTAADMDSDPKNVPTENISCVCRDFKYNNNTDYVLLVGNQAKGGTAIDSLAVVWRNIIEKDKDSNDDCWAYVNYDSKSKNPLKSLNNLTIVNHGDMVMAFGGKGMGGSNATPFSKIYISVDGGMQWESKEEVEYPYGFDKSASAMTACTDGNEYIWIMLNDTGQVWRGRVNSVAWGKK